MNNRTEAKLTDLIGMQKAIEEILKQAWERGRKYGQNEERPTGEWKTNLTTGDIFCSCCKEVRRDTRINHINFCNSCGADMRKGEEK